MPQAELTVRFIDAEFIHIASGIQHIEIVLGIGHTASSSDRLKVLRQADGGEVKDYHLDVSLVESCRAHRNIHQYFKFIMFELVKDPLALSAVCSILIKTARQYIFGTNSVMVELLSYLNSLPCADAEADGLLVRSKPQVFLNDSRIEFLAFIAGRQLLPVVISRPGINIQAFKRGRNNGIVMAP